MKTGHQQGAYSGVRRICTRVACNRPLEPSRIIVEWFWSSRLPTARFSSSVVQMILSAFILSLVIAASQADLKQGFSLSLPTCSSVSPDEVCSDRSAGCKVLNGWFCNELLVWPHSRGVDFLQIGSDGTLTPLAEFVSKCNAFNVLPKVINGQVVLYHSRASSCNCPEPGVKPCPLQLQLRTTTAGVPLFMSYLEADRSLPIPLLPNDITSEIVLVNADDDNPALGCSSLVNAGFLRGKFALVYRGQCTFQSKISRIEQAGAVAVIVVERPDATGLIQMSAKASIPAIIISFAEGEMIRLALQGGHSITGSLGPNIGQVVANPDAVPPSGLSTISLDSIFQGGVVTATPHTSAFQFASGIVLYDEVRNHMWVLNPDYSSAIVKIFSLDDSFANPTLLATLLDSSLADSLSGSFFSRGTTFYLAAAHGSRVEIWDVTDVTNPIKVSELPGSGASLATLSQDSNYLYVPNVTLGVTGPSLLVYNIQDPTAAALANVVIEGFATVGSTITAIVVQANLMWVAWASDGLALYDITKALYPKDLEYTDPFSSSGSYTTGLHSLCLSGRTTDKVFAVMKDDNGNQNLVTYNYSSDSDSGGAVTPQDSAANGLREWTSALVATLGLAMLLL